MAASTAPAADQEAAQTILVCDDERTVRTVLAGILRSMGFRVLEAERGEKCLFMALDNEIDGFLIDVNMPRLSGLELCRRLRDIERYRMTPIICITADEDDELLGEVLNRGADDFINKPIRPNVLKARLNAQLQKQSYFQEMQRVRANLNRYVSTRTQRMVEAYSVTGDLPEPELTEACILFSDVRGFTSLSQQMDPNHLFFKLNHHLGKQVDIVYKHGGYIDKFAGDGLMAVFDSADMTAAACRCAIEIIEFTRGELENCDGQQFMLGIGINRGPALVGNIGSQAHLDFSVIGQSVNVAARLCGFAEPQSIVVADSVAREAENLGELRFTAPWEVNIRGLREPLTVYNLEPSGRAIG